ncbi:MAG TPA: NAD(P)H-quinone oxidoreductase [Kofleriaceae bacterium]|jgi:putative PIG3 family NAD(P)H quinone oxidoreductase
MRAIAIAKPGGPETLVLVERPQAAPLPDQVRVRVRATAVNRADLLQRMGMYPAPPDVAPDIPGLEFAGEVDAVGPNVERLRVGDRVFGLVGGGSYAEYLVTHERAVAKIPDNLSFEQAAAVPEAFVTAYDALVDRGGFRGGDTILVSAAGSGVGTATIQLGHALGGYVVGTARTADKLERCKPLGLDLGVVPEAGRFAGKVPKANVIVELVGGAYLAEDVLAIQTQGTIVLVGMLGGNKTEVDMGLVMHRRAKIVGTMLRSRPLEEKLAAMRVFEANVVPLFARGLVKPIVETVLPLADAAKAHELMASNSGFGKIVLRV